MFSLQDVERERKEAEEEAKKAKKQAPNTLLGFFKSTTGGSDEEGSLEFSFAGLFKIMCCTHQKPIDEKQQLLRIASTLDTLNKRLDAIERAVDPHGAVIGPTRRRSASRTSARGAIGAIGPDGLASVHEDGEGSNFNDDSDDESENMGT